MAAWTHGRPTVCDHCAGPLTPHVPNELCLPCRGELGYADLDEHGDEVFGPDPATLRVHRLTTDSDQDTFRPGWQIEVGDVFAAPGGTARVTRRSKTGTWVDVVVVQDAGAVWTKRMPLGVPRSWERVGRR